MRDSVKYFHHLQFGRCYPLTLCSYCRDNFLRGVFSNGSLIVRQRCYVFSFKFNRTYLSVNKGNNGESTVFLKAWYHSLQRHVVSSVVADVFSKSFNLATSVSKRFIWNVDHIKNRRSFTTHVYLFFFNLVSWIEMSWKLEIARKVLNSCCSLFFSL